MPMPGVQGSRANDLNGFVQLPFELLTEIILGSMTPLDRSKGTKRLWSLARVCQGFWKVILGEARFWCHITSSDLDHVHLQLLRSGHHPLHIRLDSQNGMSAAHVQYLVDLVGVMYHRWETLTLNIDPNHASIIKVLLDQYAPPLRALQIVMNPKCPWSCLQIEILPDRLSVESAWLGGIQVRRWTGGANQNLTTLKLEQVKFWAEGFSGMLEACPNIESLEINHLHAVGSFYASISRVVLPRLRRLVVKSPVVGPVLFCVIAENLQTLHAEQQDFCFEVSERPRPTYDITSGELDDVASDSLYSAAHSDNLVPPFGLNTFMTKGALGPLTIIDSRNSLELKDAHSKLHLVIAMDQWEQALHRNRCEAMLKSSKCHLTLHLSNFHNLYMLKRVGIRSLRISSPLMVEGVVAFLTHLLPGAAEIHTVNDSMIESAWSYPFVEEIHLPLLNWKEMSKIRPLLRKMLHTRAGGHYFNETENGETLQIKFYPIRIYGCDGREVDVDWTGHSREPQD